MDHQRNAMELLAKIAECLSTECATWLSNCYALTKANEMEEKAKAAAEKKAQKAEERAAERARKKEQAAAKAEAKKAAQQQATCHYNSNYSTSPVPSFDIPFPISNEPDSAMLFLQQMAHGFAQITTRL